ncbi:hypothetical protein LCGC14_1660330 [marine sediment metagenome]|uniref:Uncharacterized protein n=1 Tax=marine sediment metagenome TaxID=412755 RepID=A0A0F9HUA0_9ZZZZ
MVKKWVTQLQPFAERLAELRAYVRTSLEQQDDKGLKAIRDACRKPTSSNCWWAIYRVTDVVSEEAHSILFKRQADAVKAKIEKEALGEE